MPTADFELDGANSTTSRRPGELLGQDLPRSAPTGRWRPVHGQVHRRLAERGPDRLDGDNNFFRSRSRTASTAATSTSSSPRTTRPRPRAPGPGRQQHHDRADQADAGHDPHALTRVHGPTRSRRSTASSLRPRRDGGLRQLRWRRELLNLDPTTARLTRPARASASSPVELPGQAGTTPTRAPRARSTSTTSGSPRTRTTARRTPRPRRRRSTRPLRRRATPTPRGQGRPVGHRRRRRRRGRRQDRVPHHHQRHGRQLDDEGQHGARQPVREHGHRLSSGTHLVEYRSTDKAANTEATKSVTFKIQLPVCDRSDEFDGTEILPRWPRHTRNGGTPTTGALAPTVPARPARCRRTTSRSTRPRRRRSDRSTSSARTCPHSATTGRWRRSSPPSTGRLAERGPDGLAGGQQLLPLDPHAQPHQQRDLVEGSKDNPATAEGRAPRRAATATSWPPTPDRSRSGCVTCASPVPTRSRRTTRSWLRPTRRRRLGRVPGRRRRSST